MNRRCWCEGERTGLDRDLVEGTDGESSTAADEDHRHNRI